MGSFNPLCTVSYVSTCYFADKCIVDINLTLDLIVVFN